MAEEKAPSTESFSTLWQAQISELEQRGATKQQKVEEEGSRKVNVFHDKAVLLVENDEDVALDYGRLLEAHGFKVSYAHTVKGALEKASSFRQFKVVVIDYKNATG